MNASYKRILLIAASCIFTDKDMLSSGKNKQTKKKLPSWFQDKCIWTPRKDPYAEALARHEEENEALARNKATKAEKIKGEMEYH